MGQPAREPWVPGDTFGGRLALLRQALGALNIKAAAVRCGLPAQSWRNWELGRRPHDLDAVCRQVSDATGADYVWLMVGESAQPRRGDRNPGFSQAA